MHRLELLGRIAFHDAQGKELRAVLAQPKRLALLAYLSLEASDGAVRRDKLLALFWPELDQDRARKALNKAVHFLRKELGDDALASRGAEDLSVNGERIRCDAVDFRRAVNQGDHAAASELYRGDLLPSFYVAGAPDLEHSLNAHRAQLRRLASCAAHLLAEQREREGQPTVAVSLARRAVELSDEDERTVRKLLELLDRLGDRAGALYAYGNFARRMASEFDATPAAETQALIAWIRARTSVGGGGVPSLVAADCSAESSHTTHVDVHPSDRYPSAAAFDSELASPGPPARALWRLPIARRTAWLGAAAIVGLASIVSMHHARVFTKSALGSAATSRQPAWILVADIAGPPGDSTIGEVVREVIASALDQSRTLASVSRDHLEQARHAAGVRESTPITGNVARHLASRTAVSFIVEGRVDRVGEAIQNVFLRASEPNSGRTVASIHGTVTPVNFVTMVDTLAHGLIAQLESRGASTPVRAENPPDELTTPSLAAYRKLVEARDAVAVDYATAIALAREAVAVDTEFAAAWAELYEWNNQVANFDSSNAAYARAMQFARRLTATELTRLEAGAARNTGDPVRALEIYDRLIQRDPTRGDIYASRALPLRDMARYDEAIQSMQRAGALSPLGTEPEDLVNLAETLASAGRVTEARDVARPLQDDEKLDAEMDIELAAGNWARAESLATVEMTTPKYSVARRTGGANNLASTFAARGRIARAYDAMKQAIEIGGGNYSPVMPALLLSVVQGKKPIPKEFFAQYDTNHRREANIATALATAWAGDTREANRLLVLLKGRRSPAGSTGYALIALVEGSIAFDEGRWRDAVSASAEKAWIGQHGVFRAGTNLMRWFVADSYERLGELDSAAAYFDLLVRPVRTTWLEQSTRGLADPFAHRRLALLYTRLGRGREARNHWKAFLAAFVNPDPEYLPLVQEARAALNASGPWATLKKMLALRAPGAS